MHQAKLSKIKNELSRYVALARKGQSVRIMVRGVAAADLVPIGDEPDAKPIPELLLPGPRARGRALSEQIIEERHKR
jgi:antitoxin (DNA-binding transcriptional repressor) of toxin-antitoxin stability system